MDNMSSDLHRDSASHSKSEELDMAILRNICKHSTINDLLSLSLVSQKLRVAAQSVLFRVVNLSGTDDSEFVFKLSSRPSAVAERLHWLHRSLVLSPQLGQYMLGLAFEPFVIDAIPNAYNEFLQVLHLATNLRQLQISLYSRQPTKSTNAPKWRNLFQTLNFTEMYIYAPQPDCIMYIPSRHLHYAHIEAIAKHRPWPTNDQVDLSAYQIDAQIVIIKGFADEQPLGLGSSFWFTSSFLIACFRPPTRLALVDLPISATRLGRLLRALGSTVENLELRVLHSLSTSETDQSDSFKTAFDWASLLPNLKRLVVDFFHSTMSSLSNLDSLHLVVTESDPPMIRALLVALLPQDGRGFPNLRVMYFSYGSLESLLPGPLPNSVASRTTALTRFYQTEIRKLRALMKITGDRNICVHPQDLFPQLVDLTMARLALCVSQDGPF